MTGKKYIHEINGLGKHMNQSFIAFFIASVSLVGIPPTNGFVSKWFLGLGAMEASQVPYIIILLFSAFLTAAYLFPVSIAAFFRRSDEDQDNHVTKSLDPPKMMLVPILLLSVVIVFLGLFPNAVIEFINVIVIDVF